MDSRPGVGLRPKEKRLTPGLKPLLLLFLLGSRSGSGVYPGGRTEISLSPLVDALARVGVVIGHLFRVHQTAPPALIHAEHVAGRRGLADRGSMGVSARGTPQILQIFQGTLEPVVLWRRLQIFDGCKQTPFSHLFADKDIIHHGISKGLSRDSQPAYMTLEKKCTSYLPVTKKRAAGLEERAANTCRRCVSCQLSFLSPNTSV
ncbi:Hypothetical predicted protein [Podarcis lilfordi]|uniref:Uncharacterized protein n=1 Tax=Podarcis lilfordi TaxID=74358 RepID=A0AA35L624_9SAUR|nr:Hypothetical predicted protein [Podarcis lilfordi]